MARRGARTEAEKARARQAAYTEITRALAAIDRGEKVEPPRLRKGETAPQEGC